MDPLIKEAYEKLLSDLSQQCLKHIRPDGESHDDPSLRQLVDKAEKIGRLKERLAANT